MVLLKMTDIELRGKRVLIREDLNVPIKNGIITSDQRLESAIPTLRMALSAGASVLLLSHLGRPEEGGVDARYSLRPIAEYLIKHLGYPVHFAPDYLEGVTLIPGELVVGENVRFNVGEKSNDPVLAKKMADLCDVFVMDAFGTAHRTHASTCGVAQFAKIAVAGPLLVKELDALQHIWQAPAKPIIALVGGAKVSSKLSLLKSLVTQVDVLIPGGGIANTFLKAQGHNIGMSLCEEGLLDEARQILELAAQSGCNIPLPNDVVVGKSCTDTCPAFNKTLNHIAADDRILDIGPETVTRYAHLLSHAKTILWNGPVGVFELPQFGYGTRSLAIAIANSQAFSIAGGGDTLSAIDKYNLTDEISYISTGGGAFLEFLEGKTLPAVEALTKRQACSI